MVAGGLQPPPIEVEEEAVHAQGQGVIFILDDAQLEVAQVGKVREYWSCRQEFRACVGSSVKFTCRRRWRSRLDPLYRRRISF